MSSTEAEYIVAAKASMEAVWMRKFIDGLEDVMSSKKIPMEMLCDNAHAIAIANDPKIIRGSRHYQRKYHYICEVIQAGEIFLKKVHTGDNLADPFTKPMPLRYLLTPLSCNYGSIDDVARQFVNVASRGWSFASAVPGPMTHLVASLAPDSANSCVMQGASCTQRKVSMVLFVLPSILLLVVIVVTVVIVVVILVVVVVAIVGVVVVVVVGSSVSSIIKLSFVIVDSFSCYWSSACLGVLVSIYHVSSLCFQSSSNTISNYLPNGILSHSWCCRC
ncbi:hypothetical protein Tco_1055618 [Tanacetum coccineum]|uniref:Uncharacterized protein n=1 Tax=Tanacetum coccineum TaxID=301880 RepID=A0ABQ5H061_9ASTR